MEFKISKKQVLGKLALVSLITIIVVYLLSAFFLINNRTHYELINTTWISRQNGTINFISETSGNFKLKDEERIYFSFTQNRGYILCSDEEVVLLELVELNDDRLFAVNINAMFYNLESL